VGFPTQKTKEPKKHTVMYATVKNAIDVITEGKEFSYKMFSVVNQKNGRNFQRVV